MAPTEFDTRLIEASNLPKVMLNGFPIVHSAHFNNQKCILMNLLMVCILYKVPLFVLIIVTICCTQFMVSVKLETSDYDKVFTCTFSNVL